MKHVRSGSYALSIGLLVVISWFRLECDLDPGPVLVSSLRVVDLAITREHSHWLVGVC